MERKVGFIVGVFAFALIAFGIFITVKKSQSTGGDTYNTE